MIKKLLKAWTTIWWRDTKAIITKGLWRFTLWLSHKAYPAQWILKGEKMMCPKCQDIDSLSRNETVLCRTFILVSEDGTWDWDTEMDTQPIWESMEHVPEQMEPEWHCGECMIDFDAPNVEQQDYLEDYNAERVSTESQDREDQGLVHT